MFPLPEDGPPALSLSHVQVFVTPWTVAHQVPLYGIPQARILEWIAVSFSREYGISVYNLFGSLFCVSYCVSSPPFTNLFSHKSVWHHRHFIL